MHTITIIGAGRMGTALAIGLHRAGFAVDALVYRSDRYLNALRAPLSGTTRFLSESELLSISSDVVIIATGDSEIRTAAERAARLETLPKIALHTSGSLSSDELSSLQSKGVGTASLHPLAAVSDPLTGPDRFRGAYFCVEGEREAVHAARAIAEALGGRPFSIPTRSKALYHAAAVISAGHLIALLDTGIELLERCGLAPDEARAVLLPLASGSIANLENGASAAALTGPYARGDAKALERHLDAFAVAGVNADVREIYLTLAARSVEILIREGRDLTRLLDQIQMAKRETE